MSLAQQKQIDLLKERADKLEKQNKTQQADIEALKTQVSFFAKQLENRLSQAIDKVIGDGLVLEQTTESQIKELMHERPIRPTSSDHP